MNKFKVALGVAIFLAFALVILGLIFDIYFTSTQTLVTQLSDNQTKLRSTVDTLYKEYVKVAAPKVFQNEADLITWLNSNKENPTLAGYMTLARQQGAFMQVWSGWKLKGTDIAVVDFGENWQDTKSKAIGIKTALVTVVGTKTYVIDIETKRFIILDPENNSGTGSWGK